MSTPVTPITSVGPVPIDGGALADRLRQTAVGVVTFFLGIPAVVLWVLTLVAIATGPLGIGIALAHAVVPATERLAGLHRAISGRPLGQPIPAAYADTAGLGFVGQPFRWLTDTRRWRDFAFLAFSGSGGFVLSGLPALLLVTPVAHLVLWLVDPSWVTWLLLLSDPLWPVAWWLATPAVVRSRALAERGIFGDPRITELQERVAAVEESRDETLDHQAAEVRRIERDLHDGAQARIASVGMSVGLAEKLMSTDPDAAAALLREARESTTDALEDMRSVVRGIHPPALADQGLAGAVEALVVPVPIPVTVALDVPRLPSPIESAAYFAVAECVTNLAKHSGANRGWITGTHDGERLRLLVGDDGRGGADPTGSGLTGVARRLDAFDGDTAVESPAGGGTVVRMVIPCPT